uniref:Uncharacterized protein n=1 Tax=Sinocyclocheilus grahami TaxID=75366 RepID=A0A672MNM6_SINGR
IESHSRYANCGSVWSALERRPRGYGAGDATSSPGVAATLAGVLIFTTVADIVGNLLVILSVYRNKKLRNAGVKRYRNCNVRQTSHIFR